MNYCLKEERGQVLVILTIGIVVLLGFAGLAVDGGMYYADRQYGKSVADNAVLAGAVAAAKSLDEVGVSESSFSCSNTNVVNAMNEAAETIATSAAEFSPVVYDNIDDYNNNEQAIYVECDSDHLLAHIKITKKTKTSFAHLVYSGDLQNTLESVTRVDPGSNGSMFGGAAIVALAKSGAGFTFNSSTVIINGGGMFVNSSTTATKKNGTNALESNWNPTVETHGGCIGVVGSKSSNFLSGGGVVTGDGFCDPKPSQIDVPDFDALIPDPPTAPTCSTTGSFNTTTHVASPGNYPTGLTIPYYGGTMQSGTYCFTGSGGFTVTGGPLTVSGGDVTMVFTGSNGVNIGGNDTLKFDSLIVHTVNGNWNENGSTTMTVPGEFRFYSTGSANYNVNGGSTETFSDGFFYLTSGTFGWQGSTNINITGPKSGDYKGLSIYMPVSNTSTVTVYGGSNVNVTGSIVIPGAYFYYQGSSNLTGLNCQIIADHFAMNGESKIVVNYDPDLNIGSPQSATIDLYQ